MSTQHVVSSSNGHGNGYPNNIPKRLRKEASMRELLFAHLDACDNRQLEQLHEVLTEYLRLPLAVRLELDRLEW
jgi:hypothetical protein